MNRGKEEEGEAPILYYEKGRVGTNGSSALVPDVAPAASLKNQVNMRLIVSLLTKYFS